MSWFKSSVILERSNIASAQIIPCGLVGVWEEHVKDTLGVQPAATQMKNMGSSQNKWSTQGLQTSGSKRVQRERDGDFRSRWLKSMLSSSLIPANRMFKCVCARTRAHAWMECGVDMKDSVRNESQIMCDGDNGVYMDLCMHVRVILVYNNSTYTLL